MLNFYRSLLWLRRDSPALYGGSYTPLDVESDCFVYLREEEGERKLIALNFSAGYSTVTTDLEGKGRLLLSTHMDREGEISLNCIKLRPYEGVIIHL
jgi:alpha-glucosidase